MERSENITLACLCAKSNLLFFMTVWLLKQPVILRCNNTYKSSFSSCVTNLTLNCPWRKGRGRERGKEKDREKKKLRDGDREGEERGCLNTTVYSYAKNAPILLSYWKQQCPRILGQSIDCFQPELFRQYLKYQGQYDEFLETSYQRFQGPLWTVVTACLWVSDKPNQKSLLWLNS